MTKHIHIHLPPGVTVSQVRTGDSDWDESKHKRADDGKFSTGGGSSAKPAAKAASPMTSAERAEYNQLARKMHGMMGREVETARAVIKEAQVNPGKVSGEKLKDAKRLVALHQKMMKATAPTRDSGDWDESKHKRDDGGKFSSGGGGGGKSDPTQGKSGAEHAEQLALGNKPATPSKQESSAPAGGDPDIEYNGKKYKAHSGTVKEMTHAQYERIQPGKVYMFDGRKALVTGKRLPTHKNAAGIVSGLPTMTVLWFKKKE